MPILLKFLSDGFVALATTHRNHLLRLGVPSEKVTVIPNPYDPEYVQLMDAFNQQKPNRITRFIYVANICENKAQDVLINAALIVLKRYPEIQFELVGKVLAGEEEYAAKLESFIKNNGLEQSIHFTGEVPYSDVFNLVQKSDIFVYPTQAEMMPRAVIEAMVIGKPVIASAVDGILDLIQNRKTGFLVQSGNVLEFAETICELIENPDLAYEVGLAGQKSVLDYCSPEKVGKQLCDFYASRLTVRKLLVPQS